MDSNRGKTRTMLWVATAFVALCAAAILIWEPFADSEPEVEPPPLEIESDLFDDDLGDN